MSAPASKSAQTRELHGGVVFRLMQDGTLTIYRRGFRRFVVGITLAAVVALIVAAGFSFGSQGDSTHYWRDEFPASFGVAVGLLVAAGLIAAGGTKIARCEVNIGPVGVTVRDALRTIGFLRSELRGVDEATWPGVSFLLLPDTELGADSLSFYLTEKSAKPGMEAAKLALSRVPALEGAYVAPSEAGWSQDGIDARERYFDGDNWTDEYKELPSRDSRWRSLVVVDASLTRTGGASVRMLVVFLIGLLAVFGAAFVAGGLAVLGSHLLSHATG